ncbi:CobW family GTP-binding protein [Celerinatantimonas diazotrophica]|uniref:G3E family GTPase n=1 Tax=Celerinatantimonas diazotrophica TaxID=412034 RepID=A0A4R1K4F1_9GAMM|nr:GTP-binding protein [Celerinatantimonas diazotrophica]TCK58998.1 G3E family GTPase [Celerinatantimonas diazotrophica]CAG9297633.1 Putative metal chaperone YciC [Celerinatantimonas diazotrophica]
MKQIPITILNGFLGAGKTTLMRHLLVQAHQQNMAVSVIVNDMSRLDIDGVLIANTDVVSQEQDNFISISGENISSDKGLALLDDAIETLIQAPQQPAWILLETSGSSHPLPLIKYLQQHRQVELHGVLAIVDALMLQNDYDSAQALIPALERNLSQNIRHIENLLCEQMMFATEVLLSKNDRLSASQIQQIAQAIHPLNPYVNIIALSWGHLNLATVLEAPIYNFHRVEKLIEELEETVSQSMNSASPEQMVARVISDDRPFHPQRLYDTCQQHLGRQVYRSKGFFWLPTRDDMALLWNQAAGSISLELVSYWRSGILQDQQQHLSAEEKATLNTQIAAQAGRFGDRRCHLTVIGIAEQVAAFARSLQQCFLTEDEILAWQNGAAFDDPWPKRLVRLS